MLPSLGLFKTVSCPYYENSGDCRRPYCHFKHAKKENEKEQNKVPVYKPTPKTPKLMTLEISSPASKKRKLEYSPTNPGLDAHQTNNDIKEIPVYIPSNSLKSNDSEIDLYTDYGKNRVSETITSNSTIVLKENGIYNNVDLISESILPKETKSKPNEINVNNLNEKHTNESFSSKVLKSLSSLDTRKQKSTNKSSSNLKNSESSKERIRSTDKKNKSSRDEKSSSSSSKHRSSRSEKSSTSKSSLHKEKSSNSNRDSSKSTSRSKSKPSSTSSSSSPSSKSKSSLKYSSKDKKKIESNDSEIQLKDNKKQLLLLDDSGDEVIEDDDTVLKQCKLIFDEIHTEVSKKESVTQLKSTKVKIDDPPEYEDFIKKRVAHDNGLNAKPSTPIIPKKANHIQNAMQAIVKRQEILRQKEKEEAEAAAREVKEAEEKLKEASEALRKAKEKNQIKLTPLIPRSYLVPPKPVRTIAPVANLVAFQRAKKKVEELRAAKAIGLTPCRTVAKAEGRIAHKISAATTEPNKLAPPVLEPNATKISYNIRSQYYNIMIKHCLTIYPNCEDAWNRAQTEELVVFKKCNTPVIYKSSCLLAINKLRKESIDAGNVCTEKNKTVSHEVILAGKLASNTSWSVNKKMRTACTNPLEAFDRLPATKAYELINELVLTEEQLVSNGYPRASKIPGEAVIHFSRPNRRPNDNPDERYCGRCSKLFYLSQYEEEAVDQCNFHPKSTGYRRGFADNLHRCCQQPASSPGCTYANYHVSDYIDSKSLSGFVPTIDRDESYIPTKNDIFALDCEMCYTTQGIEITRITVVDINSKTVYDALIQPDNKIVDYNTVYSGITEEMLKNETRTLRDVQAILLSMFHSKTILIGHSLESDMKALKILHSHYVDTSILYPHKMGPPMKRALKTLCIENLKRIIQENEHGHDSAEDAEVCIQLVKVYLKNKIT